MLFQGGKFRVITGIVIWTVLIALLGGAVGYFAGSIINGSSTGTDERYALLDEVAATLDRYALHPQSEKERIVQAAKGMVMLGNDQYAAYYTKDEYAQYVDSMNGNYVGVGIMVESQPDVGVVVVQVYTDSPAARAGLMPGDVLVAVDGEDITGVDYNEVVERVTGEAGTQVEITVLRSGERLTQTMTRAAVNADRVTWKIARGDIGYIRIIEFSGNALTLFTQAINELSAAGCEAFIIDLRFNPGGDREIVVSICDMLLPEGPILHLKNRDGEEIIDRSDASFLNKPMAVLINGSSASASELMAGSIQDYGAGTLIGTSTYGKGVAQSFRTLSDGSVLKYTSEDYLTPSGRSVQDVGVIPDIELELDENVVSELQLATAEDNQYQKAIEVLREKLIEKGSQGK